MTTTTTPPVASIYRTGELYQVPPGQLVLERNIRDARPDPELAASVAALGVIQPITAVIGDDGRLVVRLGHRRTLAALEAGRDTVPVYVVDVDDTSAAAEVQRVIAQHDENTLRAGLTAGDELGVVEQLTAFGLSADEIAAQARIGRDKVDTAVRVSKSKLAAKATTRYESLTLEQAATVAEFDDDTETAKALIAAAVSEPASFNHVAQRARDERIRAHHREKLLADLEAAGVKVVKQPEYTDKTKPLELLLDADRKQITLTAHKKCPGHVAWVATGWKPVDADGNIVARKNSVREMQLPEPRYGCRDPRKHGHAGYWSSSSSPKPKVDEMSPEEREKAKAERQLVIENNKAWEAATVVRRDWLREFATRKAPPAGAASFLAAALLRDLDTLNDYRAHSTLADIAGVGDGYGIGGRLAKELTGITEPRATVIALIRAFAGYEAVAGGSKDTWRGDGTTNPTGRYLRFLESAGYGLSDVEKFAISKRTV